MPALSTEMPLDMLGKYMALEEAIVVMMAMFLSDAQRDRLRPALSRMRQTPWQPPQMPAEVCEQIQIGREALFDRMLGMLDAHVEP